MESLELASFFRSVPSWPVEQVEFDLIAERAVKLLHATFAAVLEEESDRGVALRSGVFPQTPGSSVEGLREFARAQTREPDENPSGRLRQIQMERNQSWGGGLSPIHHAVVAPILVSSNDGREGGTGSNAAAPSTRTVFAWLVVGSPRPLSARDEALFVAAVQHLSDIARIHRLETMIDLRSQFLSIASHELKTPLTAIYGVLQLQERMLRVKRPESESPERQHSYLRMTIRQVERLNELIDGLLDVSRIQNGRFMVEPTETDVSAILAETLAARLSVIANEASVKIQSEGPLQLKAWVDPVRFEEVITNLVMNSIRFSPEGGMVWVKLKEEEGGGFRLIVRDQGPNVPIEDRERIFHPFERAQRTARLGGLGLGLFISRQIAQLHGGSVSLVESVPGKGNVFEASFPNRGQLAISA